MIIMVVSAEKLPEGYQLLVLCTPHFDCYSALDRQANVAVVLKILQRGYNAFEEAINAIIRDSQGIGDPAKACTQRYI